MTVLFKIIKKNFYLLMRSKRSAFMLLFGPLFVILLLGFAFNNANTYQLQIGVYSDSYSNFTNNMVDSLSGEFAIVKGSSSTECIDGVKNSITNLCLVFSPDISIDGDMDNKLSIYLDYSKVNLAYMVIDAISSEISSQSNDVTKDLTGRLIQRIERTEAEINKDKKIISDMVNINNELKSSISTVEYHFKSQDLTFNKADYSADGVVSTASTMQERVSILAGNVRSALSSIQGKVQRLNVTNSEKEEIENVIKQTNTKVDTMNSQMMGKEEEIKESIGQISSNLLVLEQKLKSAMTNREGGYTEIEYINGLLNNNRAALDNLTASFNIITSDFQSIEVSNVDSIAVPIQTVIEPISSEKTHFNYVYPSLLVLLIMFVSILLSSTLVVMEKSSKAFVRTVVTPIRDYIFVTATYLTSLILISAQLLLLFIVSLIFVSGQFSANLLHFLLCIFLIASFFILFGMSIGYLFKKQDAATLASFSIGCLFMLFSGFILPLESMPTTFRSIATYNPFVISETLLRKLIFFNFPFADLLGTLLLLAGYCIFVYIIILVFRSLVKKQFMKQHNR